MNGEKALQYALGHEILSESISLAMLYFVEKNDRKLFDRQLKYMEQNMTNDIWANKVEN